MGSIISSGKGNGLVVKQKMTQATDEYMHHETLTS